MSPTRPIIGGALALCACTAAANAAVTVTFNDLLAAGNGPVQIDDDNLVTAMNTGGAFAGKTIRGVQAVGIAGGSVNAEIDNDEAIDFTFDTPVFVTELSIAHLYTSGNFGDTVDEAASIFVTPANAFEANPFTITASNADVGDWDGLGVLTNTSIADNSGGGAWTVAGSDIFGGPVSSLSLGSANPGSSAFGDFGFVSLTVVPVPAPGSTTLAAAAGLITLRRRRR